MEKLKNTPQVGNEKHGHCSISRREFFCGAITAAGVPHFISAGEKAADSSLPSSNDKHSRLIVSAPVLQNAAEQSMGIAFAVSADASGWVEIASSPDMRNARRVHSGELGMMEVNGNIAQILVRDLRPATRYWYHIGADRIEYKSGYRMKNLGSEIDGKVHSFTTLGAEASGSFCIINDTHDKSEILDSVLSKLAELKPSAVIWNGDATNTTEDWARALRTLITPHPNHPEFASDTPFLFLNGNHDFRGRFARHLERVWMFRDPAERSGRFAQLGRNFVQRIGDVALVGLDTGEDKPDTYPAFAGIFQMDRYRDQQTEWLAEEVEKPAIKTARFKVAFCHIPLYHPDWRNPNLPAGDGPIKGRCAAWSRPCAMRWRPLLEKAGINLVVSGHTHKFTHYAPSADCPWTQIIGGGCSANPKAASGFPTVIEGRIEDGRLRIRAHNCINGKIVYEQALS